jgi:hypothetical protein
VIEPPALRVLSPEFKPQSHQKIKKEKKPRKAKISNSNHAYLYVAFSSGLLVCDLYLRNGVKTEK